MLSSVLVLMPGSAFKRELVHFSGREMVQLKQWTVGLRDNLTQRLNNEDLTALFGSLAYAFGKVSNPDPHTSRVFTGNITQPCA